MIRKMRYVFYSDLLNRWNVKLAFQPDWQEYEGEYRHIEFGSRVFELRSPEPLKIGDTCILEHYCDTVVERVVSETVWITDPRTGEPIQRERTLLAPVSDVDEQELDELSRRLLIPDFDGKREETILLDDGSRLQARDIFRYRIVRSHEQPEWKLVRVKGGKYTPFYMNEPVLIGQQWPKQFTELAVLWAENPPNSEWRVTYALWPVTE